MVIVILAMVTILTAIIVVIDHVVFPTAVCTILFLLAISLFALLLGAFSAPTLTDHVLLALVQVFVLLERMLTQITHVNVDFGLICAHIIVYLTEELLKSTDKFWMFLHDVLLLGVELVLNMLDELLEELLIIEDQF